LEFPGDWGVNAFIFCVNADEQWTSFMRFEIGPGAVGTAISSLRNATGRAALPLS
jgi:hypothetical protein